MYLSTFRLCNRVLCRVRDRHKISSRYKQIEFRTLCQAANNKTEPEKRIISKKFPDYEIIYNQPVIRICSALNRIKTYATVFSAASLLGIPSLFAFGVLTVNQTILSAIFVISTTLTLHMIGLLFNNLVGIVYVKETNGAIKISYVDYWGRRIDIDTTISQIIPITETSQKLYYPKFYRNFDIESCEKPFKIDLKFGQIIEKELFDNVFGEVNI